MSKAKKIEINKPKHQEHEVIQDVVQRKNTTKRNFLSSYSDFKINADLLLDISQGNEKLVEEVQEYIDKHQRDDATIGGFLAIAVFRISKDDLLSEQKSEWIHVVFDHGHGVNLIAGRIAHTDWTYSKFLDRSILYSMATMLQRG